MSSGIHKTKFFQILAAASLIAMSGGAALAATAEADVPVLMPTSSWLIGSAAIDSGADVQNVSLPCVMANQYDNGFLVRVSGGGGKIMAMAVDFRQPAFNEHQRYDVTVRIAPSFEQRISAFAHDRGTLLLSFKSDDGLYQALKGGQVLGMDIAGNQIRFSLNGAAQGMGRMEACFNGSPASAAMPKSASALPVPMDLMPSSQPMASALAPAPEQAMAGMKTLARNAQPKTQDNAQNAHQNTQFTPEMAEAPPADGKPLSIDADLKVAFDKLKSYVGVKDESAKQAPAAGSEGAGESAVQAAAPQPPTVWKARKNEDVRAVLERWSAQAGVPLVWSASADGKASKDFRFEGAFEEAVGSFLRDAGGKAKVAGHFSDNPAAVAAQASAKPVRMPAPEMKVTQAPAPAESAPPGDPLFFNGAPQASESIEPAAGADEPPAAVASAASQSRFRALGGANLRDVLELWSKETGVKVLWQAEEAFGVKESISLESSYENAVRALLEQYDHEQVRPVGEVYRDQVSGQNVLVIKTDRAS